MAAHVRINHLHLGKIQLAYGCRRFHSACMALGDEEEGSGVGARGRTRQDGQPGVAEEMEMV